MIKIMTKDGISLDLAPDAEFVIEYNNPMMEDDRIPVPFSTSIALLPSATNCKVLRYLPALKLEPTVKKLAASLVFNGIPFLTGTLIYDGIEDGNLNYTFSGRDLEDEWGKKIYALDIPKNITVNGEQVQNDGVCYPLLVDKDSTGSFVQNNDEISTSREYNNVFTPKIDIYNKYRNVPDAYGHSVWVSAGIGSRYLAEYKIPVISVNRIITGISVGDDIKPILNHAAVIAQYKVSDRKLDDENVAEHLPDMSLSDFVVEFQKLLCSAVFLVADTLVMKSFEDISSQAASDDWTSMVSDSFSSDVEDAVGYVFGYDNSGEDSANLEAEEITEVDSLAEALYVSKGINSDGAPLAEFRAVRVTSTGDYISTKGSFLYCHTTAYNTKEWRLVAAADILFQNNLKCGESPDGLDPVDNICGFNLVKCIPSILNKDGKVLIPNTRNGAVSSKTPAFSLAPAIDFPNREAERGSDVYIGLVNKSQMTDTGRAMPDTVPEVTKISDGSFSPNPLPDDVPLIPDGSTEPISLRPDWLYEHFHKRYAQWLATDRQVISCDVNLNEFDLLNFRMYNKVRLHGRDFFVKKLSVTLRAGSEALECSADFISA